MQDANRYNICFRNGFFKIGLTGNWFQKSYKKKDLSLKRDKSVNYRQFPLAAFPLRYWGEEVPSLSNVMLHPRADDPFWKSDEPGSGVDYRNAMLKSTVPVLLKTAFYDIYTDGVCAMWREMPESRRANCSLVIDASNHSGRRSGIPAGMVSDFPGGSRDGGKFDDVDWFDSVRNKTPFANAPEGKVRYYALWEMPGAWLRNSPTGGGRYVCLSAKESVRTGTIRWANRRSFRDPAEYASGECRSSRRPRSERT